MSSQELPKGVAVSIKNYDFFSGDYRDVFRFRPDILAEVSQINRLIKSYLTLYGVSEPSELPEQAANELDERLANKDWIKEGEDV